MALLNNFKKILLINFGGIGDEILFLPVIDALKKQYPEAEITLCLEKRSSAFIFLTDLIYATKIFFDSSVSRAILPSFILQTTVPPEELKTITVPFIVMPKFSKCFFVFSSATIFTILRS